MLAEVISRRAARVQNQNFWSDSTDVRHQCLLVRAEKCTTDTPPKAQVVSCSEYEVSTTIRSVNSKKYPFLVRSQENRPQALSPTELEGLHKSLTGTASHLTGTPSSRGLLGRILNLQEGK